MLKLSRTLVIVPLLLFMLSMINCGVGDSGVGDNGDISTDILTVPK